TTRHLSTGYSCAPHPGSGFQWEHTEHEMEEVGRMMGQKTKEEKEKRKEKKELEGRMSPEKTQEQILKLPEKLCPPPPPLQEEKHQLFLQLKKKEFSHEGETGRPGEQSTLTTASAMYEQSWMVRPELTSSAWEDTASGAPSGQTTAKQVLGPQVLTTQSRVGSAAAFVGTPEPRAIPQPGSAYGSARPAPDSRPTQSTHSAGEQLRAREQHVPAGRGRSRSRHRLTPRTAAFRPPRHGRQEQKPRELTCPSQGFQPACPLVHLSAFLCLLYPQRPGVLVVLCGRNREKCVYCIFLEEKSGPHWFSMAK
uniref:Uncharacterized protein n=1 Tax=Panthera leo TaxID=9689 RepID=A0A8C8WQJ1_PANLE